VVLTTAPTAPLGRLKLAKLAKKLKQFFSIFYILMILILITVGEFLNTEYRYERLSILWILQLAVSNKKNSSDYQLGFLGL
jgi:hypothetical protein